MKIKDNKHVYPVVITPPKKGDKFFLVYVPDIDRMTQGETFAEALEMAQDLICVHAVSLQDSGQQIPAPSMVEPTREDDELVSWVAVDFDAYRRSVETRAVHKDVTIPAYMADRAKKMNISLSALLQEALKDKIGLPE
ncbi:MAG: type II toxin-antitoxin system HicB family antitoxin [Oscillospiraceae bacterium]|jgi:predicted RNase H-like HicB family nuclease|nr:type II toxin-antitoxin system HicB family antitoxin [Oscillospiraceae bacterium]